MPKATQAFGLFFAHQAIDCTPLNARSWMGTSFPYWEGPVSFTGSHTGLGYLEMTGY